MHLSSDLLNTLYSLSRSDAAGQRDSWTEPDDGCAAARKVPELLAEQVEAADLLLINKIDLAGAAQVGVASGVARGLNRKASVMEVEFGRVDARELLGRMLDDDGGEDEAGEAAEEEKGCCSKSDCTDASHDHDHDHNSHSHDQKTTSKTSADHLGISSFVYRSSTPFNSQRLMVLLNRWPIPIKDSLDFMAAEIQEFKGDRETANEFMGVLRSKVCSCLKC
jgi:G3E family GTPase